MTLIEKLRAAMTARGLSQDAVEKANGLSQGRISKWAGEIGEPTAKQALRLARYLDIPVEYLIDDEIDRRSQVGPAVDAAQRIALKLIDQIGIEEALEALYRLKDGRAVEHGPAPTGGKVGTAVDPRTGVPLKKSGDGERKSGA